MIGFNLNLRRKTNVEQLLDIVGLGYLAPYSTVFAPFLREQDKKHYLDLNGGRTPLQPPTTFSQASTKRIWADSLLTAYGAGVMSNYGYIEPLTANKLLESDNYSSQWDNIGSPTKTNVATGGPDGGAYIHLHCSWTSYVLAYGSGLGAGGSAEVGFFLRVQAGARSLFIQNHTGSANGYIRIELSLLPVQEWVWITRSHKAVTVENEFVADGSGWVYLDFRYDDGAAGFAEFDVAKVMATGSQNYISSPIITAGTAQNRSADSWYHVGDFSGCKSFVTGLKFPYHSTRPAADVYHFGINIEDGLNGAFIYTKAADDHLYAALRSGDAEIAAVDLGAYVAGQAYSIAVSWDTALRACINGVEGTPSGAITPPSTMSQWQLGRGISTDAGDGCQHPFAFLFNVSLTAAQRASLTAITNWHIPIAKMVCSIGDSIMNAWAATSWSIPGRIEVLNQRFTWDNMPHSGDTMAAIEARFAADVVAKAPVYAVIEGGINDLNSDGALSDYITPLTSILDQCAAAGIIPVLCQIAPCTNSTAAQMRTRDTWKAAAASLAAGYGALVVDFDATMGQFRVGGDAGNLWDMIPALTTDGTHPTFAGTMAYGAAIYAKLDQREPVFWP